MNKRYKIAIIGGALSVKAGGAARSIAQQASILKNADNEVSIFVGESKKYPLTIDEFPCENCSVISSKLWGPGVLGFFPLGLFKLWQNAPNYDFIHLNGAWNLTTFFAALIARHRKRPYIISMRGHLGEYHFTRMPLLKKVLFATLEKHNIKHALAMHATAQWEVETSAKALRFAKNVIIIPNPVDLSDFQDPPTRETARKNLGLNKDDFHVIHLGRTAKQKNLIFLINAFAKANLGKNAFLTFIGPAEPKLKKEMQKQIEKLDVKEQINFIEFAKGKERCDWFAAADLFALPSFDENFCIAAVESVASGTHCLLSPHVGVVEFLPKEFVTSVQLNEKLWVQAIHQILLEKKPQSTPAIKTFSSFSDQQITTDWNNFYETK